MATVRQGFQFVWIVLFISHFTSCLDNEGSGIKSVGSGTNRTAKIASSTDSQSNSSTSSQVQCDHRDHELPLYTHFDAQQHAFVFGASDQAIMPVTFKPALNHYWADRFDDRPIDDNSAIAFAREVCLDTGVKVTFIHAKQTQARPGLAQGVTYIHGAVISGSIAHIILPENWSKNSANKYPILAFSHYSANASLLEPQGKAIVETIARTSKLGGAIGFIWNGGGSINTTQNPQALRQFSDVLAYIEENYRGDRQRIAVFGGSRGGGAALTLASNPKGYPYRVQFAYAFVPPTNFHTIIKEIGTAFPSLLTYTSGFMNDPYTWHPSWRDADTGHPLLKTWMQTFNDTTQIGAINWVDNLVQAKTKVALELHSHDEIVPYYLQYAYYRALVAAGGSVEADVLLLAGHGAGKDHFPTKARMLKVIKKMLAGDALHTLISPGIRYKLVDHQTGAIKPLQRTDNQHPFTLHVPRVAFSGMKNRVIAVGEKGTKVEIALINTSGKRVQSLSGTIGNSGSIRFNLNDQQAGTYTYEVFIEKIGATQKRLNTFFTPGTAIQKMTTLFQSLPESTETAASIFLKIQSKIPTSAKSMTTGWGLSEYSSKKVEDKPVANAETSTPLSTSQNDQVDAETENNPVNATASATQVDEAPKMTTFYYDPAIIQSGQSTFLNWESENATECYAVDTQGNKTGDSFASSHSLSVTPTETSGQVVIRARCARDGIESPILTATLTVQDNRPKLTRFYFEPTSIQVGQQPVLKWESVNATRCYFTDVQGNQTGDDAPTSGEATGNPETVVGSIVWQARCASDSAVSDIETATLEVHE